MNTVITDSELPSVRAELIIVVCIVVVLATIELFLVTVQQNLSANVRHIANIPTVAGSFRDNQDFRVLFLGNSLTYDGIDTEVFRQELTERLGNSNVSVEKIAPDSTSLWEWDFIFEKHFSDPAVRPDLLIVSFAAGHLVDRDIPDPSRLAAFYCDVRDLPKLYRLGLRDTELVLEFVLADASSLFASRKLVRSRLLDTFVPKFRDVSQRVNTVASTSRPLTVTVGRENSFNRLGAFLKGAVNSNSETVFIAMPMSQAYSLDPGIATEIKNRDAHFLDLRNQPEINPQMFKDVMHLNPGGARVYSALLAHEIAKIDSVRSRFKNGRQAR